MKLASTALLVLWSLAGCDRSLVTTVENITLAASVTKIKTSLSTVPQSSAIIPHISRRLHEVRVGADSSYVFYPPNVSANSGDVVLFRFFVLRHSIVESAPESPCQPMDRGFNSGIDQNDVAGDNNNIVALTVTSAEPRLFFLRQQTGTCDRRMIFGINSGANV